MSVAPAPEEIYRRAEEEGARRLGMSKLEEISTAFIAGVTIVFGIIALGIVEHLIAPAFGEGPGKLAGALAFAIGVVFLVVGRSELFTENFFDPVATAIDRGDRSTWLNLGRLWVITLTVNLVGGCVMAAIFAVDGTLPSGAHDVLAAVAEEIAGKGLLPTFTRAIAAGTLLTLLSYLLHAVNSVGSRMALAFITGFVLALGPLDHVVVSALHLVFGVWLRGDVTYVDVARNIGVSTAGNLIGGLVLMTLTHTAQVKGANRSQ